MYIGDILPNPKDTITDIGSDESLTQIAFYGIGQVYLQRTPDRDRDTYQVDLTSLGSLEPRVAIQYFFSAPKTAQKMARNSNFLQAMNLFHSKELQ